MKTRVRCRFPSPRMRATARVVLAYRMERGTPPKNATAALWHRRTPRSSPPDRPSRSRHYCGEGRRQGSGPSCAPHRRSPPSPRRSPAGRGPRGDAGARTSRATEAAARSSSRIRSMIPVNASSFGRRRGMLRRYPGGTENDSILRTVLRSNPNTREAWRVLIPATRHARRTRAYISTRYIPPPPVRATLTEGYTRSHSWSAAAGSTGRLSGGLLRRRSHQRPQLSGAVARR